MRIGVGYDLHRLGGGRPFYLGGVRVEYPRGPVGHSDGDPLVHAVIDALLGAAGLGDIGSHFPSQDRQWRNVASAVLLQRTMSLIGAAGFQVRNLDATVVLERPVLRPYITAMRRNLASYLGTAVGCINVKAKTNEGVGTLGRGQAVAAHVVVLLEQGAEGAAPGRH